MRICWRGWGGGALRSERGLVAVEIMMIVVFQYPQKYNCIGCFSQAHSIDHDCMHMPTQLMFFRTFAKHYQLSPELCECSNKTVSLQPTLSLWHHELFPFKPSSSSWLKHLGVRDKPRERPQFPNVLRTRTSHVPNALSSPSAISSPAFSASLKNFCLSKTAPSSTYPSCQLDIFRLNGDALGVDSAKIRILEQVHYERLCALLQRLDSLRLPA